VPTWATTAGYDRTRTRALAGETRTWFEHMLKNRAEELKQQSTPLPESLRVEMSRIVDLVRARGAEPIFFIPPGLNPKVNYREAPAGARLVSFSRPDLYPELFSPDLFRDRSHLNRTGAAVFSSLLARFLVEATRDRRP
jgi:hypothetical protein